MSKKSDLTDVKTLRKQARQHIDDGAVTAGYAADAHTVIKLLMMRWPRNSYACCVTAATILWPTALNLKVSQTSS